MPYSALYLFKILFFLLQTIGIRISREISRDKMRVGFHDVNLDAKLFKKLVNVFDLTKILIGFDSRFSKESVHASDLDIGQLQRSISLNLYN